MLKQIKTIFKSYYQRNKIKPIFTDEDLDLFKTAVSQCPSKQNIAFYKVHFIFDANLIQEVYQKTQFKTQDKDFFKKASKSRSAQLLIAFEELDELIPKEERDSQHSRNSESESFKKGVITEEQKEFLKKDRDNAVGIAAGYLNLTTSLLGYWSEYAFFPQDLSIPKTLSVNKPILLLVGLGKKAFFQKKQSLDFAFSKDKLKIEINTVGKPI